MEKIAIFVDIQNIYYTTRQAWNRHFDYFSFWRQATHKREVIAACAYAIDRGDSRQRQFQDILRRIGFDVKLKPYIQRSDGSAKGDWDVGITLDAMEQAEKADTIILLSGDGDFDLLLQRARQRFNTESEVYGVAQLTADSLISSATRFIPIQEDLLVRQKNQSL